jgi:hypothetical protein
MPAKKSTTKRVPYRDRINQAFGQLTILEYRNKNQSRYWCLCVCGNYTLARCNDVISGNTKSCGCGEIAARYTHGLNHVPEYVHWCAMKARCYNPNNKKYHLYGGQGVQVCERWLNDFPAFYADMGPRPSPKHTVDRYPNNHGNYEPTNTRWATYAEQNRNTSANRIISFRGVTQCLTDWAIGLNMSFGALRKRLARWPLDRALTEPVHVEFRR